jgi:DNA-binding SARP family transcriptional activator
VASTLWPNLTEERAFANLRSTIWRLRQLGCVAVDSPGEDLKLAEEVEVDVYQMVQLAHEILDGSARPPGWRAIAPLTGELLPEWDDEWVLLERERLRQLRLHALEVLSDRLTGVGRLPESVEVAVAAVAIDPLRESARRTLIRAHLAEGNLGEAFRQYEDYRKLLRDELGLDPTPLMQGLIRETWAS